MIPFDLSLRYHEARQRMASAVFLPGDDPRVWLTEIVRWGVSTADLRLCVVPISRSNPQVRGVLVCLPASEQPPADARGQRYGVLGGRLYLPVEATLSSEIFDQESSSLFGTTMTVLVWHPQTGLTGFEDREILSIADLLSPPVWQPADWSWSEPGTAFNSRLHSVQAQWPESPEQMLANAGGDIGSKSDDLNQLGKGAASTMLNVVTGIAAIPLAIAALIGGALGKLIPLPGVASSKMNSFFDRLAKMFPPAASRALQKASDLFNERAREINRLLKMLEDSPDEGLKYALPMSGTPGHPGTVRPSSRLMPRTPIFNLFNFGQRGPADVWNLPPDMQQELLAKYRRLAEREVGLGRYLRAAYIYAELLGDLNSAAATLMNGRHFREAAVLYRDKLKRPLEAAKCLEKGGLLHEAIPLYEELKLFADVGRLYAQMDEVELAKAAYRRHVQVCLAQGRYLEAAQMFERELEEPDDALKVLNSGWNHSTSPRECLIESFALMGRLGRHDSAGRRVSELMSTEVPRQKRLSLVEGLANAAHAYPHEQVRRQAADAVVVTTSAALIQKHEAGNLMLRHVAALTPEDKLLPRDVERYLRPYHTGLIRRPPPPSQRRGELVARLERIANLNPGIDWQRFAGSTSRLYGFGVWKETDAVVTVREWESISRPPDLVHPQFARWQGKGFSSWPPLMVVDETVPAVYVRTMMSLLNPLYSIPPDGESRHLVGSPSWMQQSTVGLATCEGISWTVDAETLVLQGFNRGGLPIANRQLVPPEDLRWGTLDKDWIPMHARHEAVFVALGPLLAWVTAGDQYHTVQLDREVRRLIGSELRTRTRLAAFGERGGTVLWPRFGQVIEAPLSSELNSPQGIFLRDGRLIVYGDGVWQMYSTAGEKLKFLGSVKGITHQPVDIVAGPSPDRIAVCTQDGKVAIYILPA